MPKRDHDSELEPQLYRDDARAVAEINRLLEGRAMRPPHYGNRRMMSVKLSQVAITGLKHVAKELGYMHNGDGNMSMLLEAIGCGTLEVSQPFMKAREM
jgi:hypothetical protein